MEAKHTPGPWEVLPIDDPTRPNAPFLIDAQDNTRIIAEVSDPDARANAALIAAAPVMLEALEDAARLVGLILAGDEAVDTADLEATYNGINAALAKAEGR
jgi:hypothetical protein